MKCPYCQQDHPDQALFCPNTGKSLARQEIPVEVPKPTEILCPACSKTIPSNSVFCPHCGHHLSIQPPIVTPPQEPVIRTKPKSRSILWIMGAIAGLGLIAIGALFLTGVIPGKIVNFISPERPTLEVKSTIDITQFQNTLSPSELASEATQSAEMGFVVDTPLATIPQEPSVTFTMIVPPTQTSTLVPTSTLNPTRTPVVGALPNEYMINEKDQAEMVFIPAGEFLMGSDPDWDPYFWGAEGPSHRVYLDGYLIYRYEVTNGMYQDCVAAGACPRPEQKESRTRPEYYGNVDYEDYPVIYVDYTSALSYCRWAGGRLPTEAEWERAARGDIDNRLFPWGSTPAEGSQANFCDRGCPGQEVDYNKEDGYNDTAPIGSYPDGMSLYGLYDTAGNVWEWTLDYFNAGYYQASPEKNPKGPQSSKHRVIRGGGWNNPSSGVRIVQRTGVNPDMGLDTLGFRCAVDLK